MGEAKQAAWSAPGAAKVENFIVSAAIRFSSLEAYTVASSKRAIDFICMVALSVGEGESVPTNLPGAVAA